MSWQPIENAPRDQRILVCDRPDDQFECYYPMIAEFAWEDDGDLLFQGDGPASTYELWMPLPAPPQ